MHQLNTKHYIIGTKLYNQLPYFISVLIGLFQKKTKQGGYGHGISRGTEERACGNSKS